MALTIKYFASLRETLGRSEDTLCCQSNLTVQEVWDKANGGIPVPANLLVAINQQYRDFSSTVEDGDEIAFFPPVTGG